jgi:hypothetical protein
LSKSLVCNSGLLTAHAALYFLVGVWFNVKPYSPCPGNDCGNSQ